MNTSFVRLPRLVPVALMVAAALGFVHCSGSAEDPDDPDGPTPPSCTETNATVTLAVTSPDGLARARITRTAPASAGAVALTSVTTDEALPFTQTFPAPPGTMLSMSVARVDSAGADQQASATISAVRCGNSGGSRTVGTYVRAATGPTVAVTIRE